MVSIIVHGGGLQLGADWMEWNGSKRGHCRECPEDTIYGLYGMCDGVGADAVSKAMTAAATDELKSVVLCICGVVVLYNVLL